MAETRLDRLDQPRGVRRSGPRYDAEAFGRFAETIARFIGTGRFLVLQTVVVIGWIAWNVAVPPSWRFDEYPFIFLTLALSLQAAYAAPLILLAQNRQTDRDRVNLEEDRSNAERSRVGHRIPRPRAGRGPDRPRRGRDPRLHPLRAEPLPGARPQGGADR